MKRGEDVAGLLAILAVFGACAGFTCAWAGTAATAWVKSKIKKRKR